MITKIKSFLVAPILILGAGILIVYLISYRWSDMLFDFVLLVLPHGTFEIVLL